jgi:transposase
MASVALARGINANLLRRWVRDAEAVPSRALEHASRPGPAFLPVQLPDAPTAAGEIRIDLRRGSTTITVAWPMAAAAECANWIRELLR